MKRPLVTLLIFFSLAACGHAAGDISITGKPKTTVSAKDGKKVMGSFYEFSVDLSNVANATKATYTVYSTDDLGKYITRETGTHKLAINTTGVATFRSRPMPMAASEDGARIKSVLNGYRVEIMDAEDKVIATKYSHKQLDDFVNGRISFDPIEEDPFGPAVPPELLPELLK